MTLSRVVGDLAPGDQKVTLNHLVLIFFVSYFGSLIPLQFPLDFFLEMIVYLNELCLLYDV